MKFKYAITGAFKSHSAKEYHFLESLDLKSSELSLMAMVSSTEGRQWIRRLGQLQWLLKSPVCSF